MNNYARANFLAELRTMTPDCSDSSLDKLISSYFPALASAALDIVRAFLRCILRGSAAIGDVWQDLRNLELEAIRAELQCPADARTLVSSPAY